MLDVDETDARHRRAPRAARAAWRARHARATARACCAASPRSSTQHNEELARLEVANSGHTIANARWEAGNVRDVLAYYSGAPERHSGKQIPVAGGVDLTFYEPLGVVGHHRALELPDAHRRLGLRARRSPRATPSS